ncbi:polymer-forming cytoskeletal protein [Paenibacillus sp.]|jgi:cytoskeletal protein CcmA (bactofilin family)|uniref:polymer-forming cytoskeletal protein n=1 Tax=Paenibacillus sp. TaxID=58172 RepID=UPI00282E7A3B|nr:polymer-forming cytoskeletal protein [Paenibacillus sp.]MDR0267681.1 polymer-forming cytoskeletal protein [Paenibacillus sp.]
MERSEMRISGIGKSQGGYYSHVRVDGMAKIKGDTDCISLDSNGTLTVEGALQSESVVVNGTVTVEGGVNANRMVLDGMATIKEQAVCNELVTVNGRLSIGKGLIGEKVEVFGSLKTRDGVQCEVLNVHGGFNIDGLLNAGSVDIRMSFPCKTQEIGGETITVRRFKKFNVIEQFVPALSARLQANIIEGDEVDLEYTEADIVRGNNVRIGKGCKIGRVEYKNQLHRDDDAAIGASHQI